MKTPALLFAALLLLLVSGIPATRSHSAKPSGHSNGHNRDPPFTGSDQTPFGVLVTNSVSHTTDKIYSTYVVYRGILLGGLRRLQDSNTGFNFTYTDDPNYGPFLQSVNGLAGSSKESTYWELLVKTTNNKIIRPDVGIGCYIPSANEQIILKYTKY